MAAGVTAAEAATVQITLTGNSIGTTSFTANYNTLFEDLTGDGINDITLVVGTSFGINGSRFDVTIGTNLRTRMGYSASSGNFLHVNGAVHVSRNPLESRHLQTVSFSDARINGGIQTNGFVEVHAVVSGHRNASLSLTRLVFDDASTTAPVDAVAGESNTEFLTAAVPEPGSLPLLALGAAGVLAHRRRRKAA